MANGQFHPLKHYSIGASIDPLTMVFPRSFTTTLLAGGLLHLVSGLPKMVITSGRPKCVNVQVAENTLLRIHYEAPDILLDRDDESYAPTYITAVERPASHLSDMMMDERGRGRGKPDRLDLKKMKKLNGADPTNEELEAVSGSFKHKVDQDGEVSICVRSSGAGKSKPMRFGIRVEEVDEEEESKTNLGVDVHLSFMEKEMNRMEAGMHNILSEANFAKERDAIFHNHSNAMHAASLFWPIVQVLVLLMTGFTQVSHMVRFFKTRRII